MNKPVNILWLTLFVFCCGVVSAQQTSPKSILDLDLQRPHLTDDTFYQSLAALGHRLDYPSVTYPNERGPGYRWRPNEDTLPENLDQVTDEALDLLTQPREYGVDWGLNHSHSRRPIEIFPETKIPEFDDERYLFVALILRADRQYRHGFADGERYLEAAVQLANFRMQNTTTMDIGFAWEANVMLADYILTTMPAGFIKPHMADWLPTWEQYQTSLDQAGYFQLSLFVREIAEKGIEKMSEDETRSLLGEGLNRLTLFFCFDQKETDQYAMQCMRTWQAAVRGPLLEWSDRREPLLETKWSNLVGMEVIKSQLPPLDLSLYGSGLAHVIGDLARIRIALGGQDGDAEQVQKTANALGLINVFTGRPYQVNPRGGLVALPLSVTENFWDGRDADEMFALAISFDLFTDYDLGLPQAGGE